MPKRSLISADNHVFEPVTLWQERLPKEYRDRGPRVEQREGWIVMAIEGMPDRKLTRTGRRVERGRGERFARSGHARRRLRSRRPAARHGARRRGRGGDLPDVRLVHRHGPRCRISRWRARRSTTIGSPSRSSPDPTCSSRPRSCRCAMSRRRARSSNASRAARVQGRDDPDLARPKGCAYNQPDYDPLWRIASDARMPLSLHTGTGALAAVRARAGRCGHQLRQGRPPLGGDAVLLRGVGRARAVPRRCISCSSRPGAGWFAYCCERMDEAFEEHEQWVNPKLARPPSASVKEQCHVTLGADRAPLLTREITGIGPLMWASDYPHPEGTFPESQQVVERIFAGVPEAELTAIVSGNAAALLRGRGARVTTRDLEGQDRDRRRRRDAVLQARPVAPADADGARGQGGVGGPRRRGPDRERPRRIRPLQHGIRHVAVRAVARACPRCGSPRCSPAAGAAAPVRSDWRRPRS